VVDGEKGVDSRDEKSIYWKERSVIRREDDVDGRASVTQEKKTSKENVTDWSYGGYEQIVK